MSYYPDPNDEDFQMKIFKKREFYYHTIPQRDKMKNYEEIDKYRTDVCKGDFNLREQQVIPTNFLSPDTPYKGLLIMHGTGTGKTCTAISIAEQFKEQVVKYNTKIFVLTSGPNIRENFKSQLLFCTGETYLKNKQMLEQMNDAEQDRENKIAIYNALQYYKILSYKTFYKRVLGEKIAEKKIVGEANENEDNNNYKQPRIKTSYKKTDEGDYERDIVVDKITNMDNTIIIVDEAHNITGNEYGDALKKIIKNSKNLRVVLLSATPMKNLADDIIDMLNFLRPLNDQIKREMIFTGEKNYMMNFKEGGEEYLRNKATGYISFFRGNIPYTFAKRVDKGDIPEGLLFTPVIKCNMEDFQLNCYMEATRNFDDKLDRATSAAANFVYPVLDTNGNLKGVHSNEGLIRVLAQLKNKDDLIKIINKKLFNNTIKKDDLSNFIIETENKNITGNILKLDYLKYFSAKFYKCIKKLNRMVEDDKGAGTAFVYSNLVKAGGMELFAESLKMNGYLEYNEDSHNYNIQDTTRDATTGLSFEEFKKKKLNMKDFHPATFIIITGGVDDSGEDIPEIKQKIIRNVFNNIENVNGKLIKLVLGSRVMNEGITLENTRSVHILDVHYNLGKVDQVIGRAIRMCKHINVINDKNRFPHVGVYRYVVALKDSLSTDEILYQKAELKFVLVKKVERLLKEVAIDCPLLLHGNKFPEEIEKYKGCVAPTLENIKKGRKICPAFCDFMDCDYKCRDKKLNDSYYDEKKGTYNNVDLKDIDHGTFNDILAKSEIDNVKQKLKDLYRYKHVYLYKELDELIRHSYKKRQEELFDNYFLDKALEDMMPKSENDFNNYKDTIYDKYNRPGYLIQRGKHYIFQPFDDNEETPMYYRVNYELNSENMTPVKNYVENKFGKDLEKGVKEDKKEIVSKKEYDFASVMDYYEKRNENFIVGIISMNQNKYDTEKDDIFKIRPPLQKSDSKKRGTGIYSLTGAVCSTSKDKEYLLKTIKKLKGLISNFYDDIDIDNSNNLLNTRDNMCNYIMKLSLFLEKYSTTKDDNKITYVMVPANHKVYPFPYNMEDRVKHIIKTITTMIDREFEYVVRKEKNGSFENIDNLVSYVIDIKANKYIDAHSKEMAKMGFKLVKNNYNLIII
jgi:DNA polymerase III delta prime subunit